MKLNKEEIETIVNHRLQKSQETLDEAKKIAEIGLWYSAANRLYYACYYAVTALLIKNEYFAYKHSEVLALLGKHFVLENMLSEEHNKLYRRIFELKQNGDYGDMIVIQKEDVIPLLEPAEKFIAEIEILINKNNIK